MKNININEFKNNSISYNKRNNHEIYLKEKILENQNKSINKQPNKINLGKEKSGKLNKIEINFDENDDLMQEKESLKLKNNIETIKDILSNNEKKYFLERMEKLGYKKDKYYIQKNRNSTSNIRQIKKYKINSINKSTNSNKNQNISKRK